MTQFTKPSLVATTDDGTTLASKFNGAISALYSMHAGATAPVAPTEGQPWADTALIAANPKLVVFKTFQGGAWFTIGTLNMTTNLYSVTGGFPSSGGTLTGAVLFPSGTAPLPSVAFAGDADTGIWRPGSNQIGMSVNGINYVTLSATLYDITTGAVRVAGASPTVNLDRASGATGSSIINFRTGALNRWAWNITGAEGTANAGSNANFQMFDDAGALIVNFLQFNRAGRSLGINGPVSATATIAARSSDNTQTAWEAFDLMNTNTAADAYVGINMRTASGAIRAAIRGERPGATNNGDLGIWTARTAGVLTRAATFRANGNLDLTGALTGSAGGRIAAWNNSNIIRFGWEIAGAAGAAPYIDVDGTFAASLVTGSNARDFAWQGNAGGPIGVQLVGVDHSGSVFVCFADATSDERIKENIRDTTVDALALVKSVPVRAFDIKADVAAWMRSVGATPEQRAANNMAPQPAHVSIGFVTQELSKAAPEAIHTPPAGHKQAEGCPLPDDLQTYSPEALVPYLWRAVQQQQDLIAALTSRITTLEASK